MLKVWRRLGIRTRVTAIGTLAVALTVTVAAVALVSFVDRQTSAAVRQEVRQRATDMAAELSTDDKDAFAATIKAHAGEPALVQVLDAQGQVLAASPTIVGQPPMTGPASGPTVRVEERTLPELGNAEFLVAKAAVTVGGQQRTVVVARSLEPSEAVVRAVAVGVAVAVPVLAVLTAVVIWLAVGSSLHSVEHITRQVEIVTSRDLHKRVPVPVPNDEIRHLAQTMNRMLERLDVAAATQRQFVADVSHELKSPLASISAVLEVGADDDRTILRDEVQRMSALVEDLLLLARTDEGGLTIQRADVDLDDLAVAEVARLRSQTELDVTCAIEAVRFSGDRARIGQVLRNLADNAARHAHTRVEITLGSEDGWAVLCVGDDGPGIPPEDRARVLQRFVRLDQHRSRSEGGAGLGLAICDEMVRLHGGRMFISQSRLGGAQVSVRLPLDSST